MLKLDGRQLLLLKGGGGEKFAHFVDQLIRAEAYVGGLAQSEIDTQVRANIGDGGVDTRVKGAVPRDRSGYLSEPTCWQYKAEEAKDLKDRATKADPFPFLTEEVQKSEVVRLVKLGFGYRFCFLGDLPAANIAEWEAHLLKECQNITSKPATPRVVAADKLVAWAHRFPRTSSCVHPFPHLIFNLDVWRSNVRAVTPEYVPNDGWKDTDKAIQRARTGQEGDRSLPIHSGRSWRRKDEACIRDSQRSRVILLVGQVQQR